MVGCPARDVFPAPPPTKGESRAPPHWQVALKLYITNNNDVRHVKVSRPIFDGLGLGLKASGLVNILNNVQHNEMTDNVHIFNLI